jgi:hypothetical protein
MGDAGVIDFAVTDPAARADQFAIMLVLLFDCVGAVAKRSVASVLAPVRSNCANILQIQFSREESVQVLTRWRPSRSSSSTADEAQQQQLEHHHQDDRDLLSNEMHGSDPERRPCRSQSVPVERPIPVVRFHV